MPFYVSRGEVPKKRHITFYKPGGKELYREELFSTKGFSGVYSLKYHIHIPSQLKDNREIKGTDTSIWKDAPVSYYHFMTERKRSSGNFLSARQVYLRNSDCIISTAHITEQADFFFRNGWGSEMIFVHHGSGTLFSDYGALRFEPYDYIVIPKGVTYQMVFDSLANVKLVITESPFPFEIPKHYRNESGQLFEDAPYYERDFRAPEFIGAIEEQGEFRLIFKGAQERMFEHVLPNHPFDVVGWDGYFYPFAFNMKEFEPKVGRLHLPPSSHLVFVTQKFVVCNFVPRLFDFHPKAIPAPYFHTNIDSDEVIYYIEGDFMSRKGIEEGSMTLHPMGLIHGPQPGKTEASVGKTETLEYALMIDTFAPLSLTDNVKDTMVAGYEQSWIEK